MMPFSRRARKPISSAAESSSGPGATQANAHSGGPAVDDARVMLHLFLAVLIVGTLWRLISYHLIAATQPQLNHLGLAMAQQY
jgi:hypothetical protein